MPKILLVPVLVLIFGLIVAVVFSLTFNQDDKNKLARKTIEHLDGNYLVTYSNGTLIKSWNVSNGKVTTSDKGYYFFWDSKNHYIQVPVINTIVEAN